MFNKGIRPAINYGSSVSRVGSAAQTKAIKKISSGIKLDLAQFREVEAFSKFSSDLDESTLALLEKGGRLVEFLKQELNSPLSLSEQVIALYCSAKGYLIDIKLSTVPEFEKHLLSHFKSQYNDFMTKLTRVSWMINQIIKYWIKG